MGVCSSSAAVGERSDDAAGGGGGGGLQQSQQQQRGIELVDANATINKVLTGGDGDSDTAAATGQATAAPTATATGDKDMTTEGDAAAAAAAAAATATSTASKAKDEEKEEDAPGGGGGGMTPIVFPSGGVPPVLTRPGTGQTAPPPRLRAAGAGAHARAGSVSLPRQAPSFQHAASQPAASSSHQQQFNAQYAHKKNQSISKSLVVRASEEEELAEAASANGGGGSNLEPASAPVGQRNSPRQPHRTVRAVSVSVPHRDRGGESGTDDGSGGGQVDPLTPTPQQLGLSSLRHGHSARAKGANPINAEPTLAQQILQRHAAAAAAGGDSSPSPAAPASPVLTRPGSGLKHSGGTTRKPSIDNIGAAASAAAAAARRPSIDSIAASGAMARRPSIDSIAAQGAPGAMRRPSIDSIKAGAHRERRPSVDFVPTSIREGMAAGSNVALFERPTAPSGSATLGLARDAVQAREASAQRTEELWVHYAGRGANHMHRRGLLMLSEDIFEEFVAKYRAKLKSQAATRLAKKGPKAVAAGYTDEMLERDLRTDLPFLLPAYTINKDRVPSREEYITYIFRFAMKEMKRVASSASGGSSSSSGTDSPGSSTAGSMQEKAPKLTKIEFVIGWTHCHELLFQAIDRDDEAGGSTPCKLM